jgi:hypothetical protein
MSDYSELKRLAEACKEALPLRYMESHGSLYIRNDHGIVFDVHQNRSFPEFMAANKAYADLALAASPAAVLALIAENERLTGFVVYRRAQVDQYDEALIKVADQRDQLKAENAGLKTGYEAYEQVVEGLRAEVEKLCATAGLQKLLPELDDALEELELHGRHSDQGYRKLKDWYRKTALACTAIDAAMGKGEQS